MCQTILFFFFLHVRSSRLLGLRGIVNIHQAFGRMHDLGEQMGLMRKRSIKAAYVRASRWHLLVKMFLSYALVPSS